MSFASMHIASFAVVELEQQPCWIKNFGSYTTTIAAGLSYRLPEA